MNPTTDSLQAIDRLNNVLHYLKQNFIGKDEIIDLMGLCLACRENLFLLGPPGTAKSAMVRALSACLSGKTFEYLLTRFTEPNELFGPFDIRRLREGELVTNTDGMLPEANLIFLDELLNANSAILNSLLMVLNEKVFRRGREARDLPVVLIVGASNHLPEDASLQALFDRFLVRVHCDYVDLVLLGQVLEAGWKLEDKTLQVPARIATEEVLQIQALIAAVDLGPIRPAYIQLVETLRNAGMAVSDRRAVKLQRLVAASALLCKRTRAIASDLWVMRHIWDTEAQQAVVAGIVNQVVAADDAAQQHPAAGTQQVPDAEAIFRELSGMAEKWEDPGLPLAERTILKDRLRYLNGRSEWITNETQRQYVQESMDALWKKVLAY